MRTPGEDTVTRWATKVMYLVASFGLAWTLGVETSPWLGWLALLIAFGLAPHGGPLKMRELRRAEDARERARPVPEPWVAVSPPDDAR